MFDDVTAMREERRRRSVRMVGLGVLLILLSIWLGCWSYEFLTKAHPWMEFPIFSTAFIGVAVGVAIVISGSSSHIE